MNSPYILLLFLTAALNAVAQFFLKLGASKGVAIFNSATNPLLKIVRVIFSPYIFAALIFLLAGMFIWLKIVARLDLNQAYPANIALTIIFVSILSFVFIGEGLSWFKVLGMLFIVAGIFFLFYKG